MSTDPVEALEALAQDLLADPSGGCLPIQQIDKMEDALLQFFEAFQPVIDWWHNREESPQAWRVDFAVRRATAIESATPHWQQAETERVSALAVSSSVKAEIRRAFWMAMR